MRCFLMPDLSTRLSARRGRPSGSCDIEVEFPEALIRGRLVRQLGFVTEGAAFETEGYDQVLLYRSDRKGD